MARLVEQNFLQSPEWEDFQRVSGHEVFRAGGSLFVEQNLPIVGKYAYSPRGPKGRLQVTGYGVQSAENEMQEILQEAKKRGCGWIRIEPNSKEELENIQKSILHFPVICHLSSVTCQRAPRDVQPREILVMDIAKSEEQLLAEMKPKTRYNIRLAEKKGVKIIVSKEEKYQARFVELVRETALRAGIRPHPESHYRKMLATLGETAQLYNAEYEGEVLAANLMIFSGDGAIYLHGGSGNAHRNVMAPFLLQWRAIQDAKKKGCRWYDFGGVFVSDKSQETGDKQEETSNKEQETGDEKSGRFSCRLLPVACRHAWAGITTFKQGFCPQTESTRFPGTYDIVLSPWRYRTYRFLNWVRRG